MASLSALSFSIPIHSSAAPGRQRAQGHFSNNGASDGEIGRDGDGSAKLA
jgi:hypothetical protein